MHSNSKCKQLIVPFMKRRTFADRSFGVVDLNIGMTCQMKYRSNLLWKVFTKLLKHTYSVNHTMKKKTKLFFKFLT